MSSRRIIKPMAEDLKPADSKPDTIKFHYIKGNHFRVIHVDGAIGGATPQGLIHVAIFSERFPIPLQTVHALTDGNIVEDPQRVLTRDGIVREIEADLMMSLDSAKSLLGWLSTTVAQVEKAESGS